MQLFLGSVEISDVCHALRNFTKYIVLKVPPHSDAVALQEYFGDAVERWCKYSKMHLIILSCSNQQVIRAIATRTVSNSIRAATERTLTDAAASKK